MIGCSPELVGYSLSDTFALPNDTANLMGDLLTPEPER